MNTYAKLAFAAPFLFALSACGGAEETAGTETEAALPVEEPMMGATTTDGAMAEDPMATDPMATDPMATDPMAGEPMTGETPMTGATPSATPTAAQ